MPPNTHHRLFPTCHFVVLTCTTWKLKVVLQVKNSLQKLTTTTDGPVEVQKKAGMKTKEDCPATENCDKERLENYSTSLASSGNRSKVVFFYLTMQQTTCCSAVSTNRVRYIKITMRYYCTSLPVFCQDVKKEHKLWAKICVKMSSKKGWACKK